ncbi:MAG: alpha/beta hydrolase fold domain-containing protein [Isosphaeraceae bacterium]
MRQRLATLRIAGIPILMVGLIPATTRADEPKSKAERDIVYTKAGSTELKLDVASPAAGEGPFPAVLVIHGGAWRAGNKGDVGPVLLEFAGRGYVAFSPQYRFCPKEVFPAQVQDVKAAVRWIKSNAKKYRVDPDRVGAMGFSAGGHLALMLGVTGPSDGLEGDPSPGAPDTRIKAVVNYFGPTDLGSKDIPDISKGLVKDFLGASAEAKPELAAKASPKTYVSKDDAAILTFQGTKDPLVPFTQAIELAEAMTAAGVPGRVELLVGAQHGWGGAEMEHTRDQTFRFFDRHLKAGAGPK